jgi:hypothetical protein
VDRSTVPVSRWVSCLLEVPANLEDDPSSCGPSIEVDGGTSVILWLTPKFEGKSTGLKRILVQLRQLV